MFNYSKKEMERLFAVPYMKNKAVPIFGGFVPASAIDTIRIFKSKKPFEEIILPDGISSVENPQERVSYIVDCLNLRKVQGVSDSTLTFITSPPQKEVKPTKPLTKPLGKKEKVFIVHGRDETQALKLQKYLTKTLKIDAAMFEDFKEESGSNTIIEQLEYIKDNVGYAFVIVTPDDLGCLRENIDKCRTTMLIGKKSITVKSVCDILDNLNARARQNVAFEHGLFIGALERDRVCCLLQEDTEEKPSDIDGILYVGFKKSVKETFSEITEKLKKAGLVKT